MYACIFLPIGVSISKDLILINCQIIFPKGYKKHTFLLAECESTLYSTDFPTLGDTVLFSFGQSIVCQKTSYYYIRASFFIFLHQLDLIFWK